MGSSVRSMQRVAKILDELGSVLAEFEWPVFPVGPWNSHFGAAALGKETDVLAHQEPLLEALYVQ